MPLSPCAQNGPQLGPENFLMGHAEPNSPKSHGRIAFFQCPKGREFIRTQIKGPDNGLGRSNYGSQIGIYFCKLIFRGEGGAVHVIIFGPVQPDAFASVVDNRSNFFKKFNIGEYIHPISVAGFSGQMADPGQTALVILETVLEFGIFAQLIFCGLDQNTAIESVQDDDTVVTDRLLQLLHPDNGRDLQGPGKDTGMGRLAPHGRGKGHDLVHFQFNGVCSGQIMGHENDAMSHGHGPVFLPCKLIHNPLGDQPDILHPGTDILVINGAEHLLYICHGLFQGPFGIDAQPLDIFPG